MIKYKFIFLSAFLIVLGILIWCASLLFDNIVSMLPETETYSESEPDKKTTHHNDDIGFNDPSQLTDNSTNYNKFDHYDYKTTTEAITDTPIDDGATDTSQNQNIDYGNVDIPLNINTQPVEDFVITDITQNQNIDYGSVDIPTNVSPQLTDNSKLDHYEITEKIITRIKKEVTVTGTTTDILGEESAMIKIGAGDKGTSFNINSQLMDGFVIIEIFENEIFLQHPVSYETFSIKVQSGQPMK